MVEFMIQNIPGLQIRVCIGKFFSLFLIQNMLWVLKKNRLNETVLLSTQNTCFNWWVRKYSQFYAHKISLSGSMYAIAIHENGRLYRKFINAEYYIVIHVCITHCKSWIHWKYCNSWKQKILLQFMKIEGSSFIHEYRQYIRKCYCNSWIQNILLLYVNIECTVAIHKGNIVIHEYSLFVWFVWFDSLRPINNLSVK